VASLQDRDSRYIDGGYRSNAENADLAAGYQRVLVLSPFGAEPCTSWTGACISQRRSTSYAPPAAESRRSFPDSDSEHMFGANAMDLSLRPPAARAGYAQGQDLAEQLIEFW
jgi:NTE family protein